MANVFGYKPTPLVRAASAKVFSTDLLSKLSVGTGDVDFRPYCTESNQYALSACAGNATADSIEILNALEEEERAAAEGRAPNPPVQLSRLFVYSMARDEENAIDKDEGTYITTCFDVLSRHGICAESQWPYLDQKVFVRPSILALRQALGHKIHSYYRITATGAKRVEEIISALRSRHPVVFGTDIDSAFRQYDGSYVIRPPTGVTIGGHAMIIVGYIEAKNAFIVKNSWGNRWGDKGFAYFSTEYLAWSRTWDVWVPTKGTTLGF